MIGAFAWAEKSATDSMSNTTTLKDVKNETGDWLNKRKDISKSKMEVRKNIVKKVKRS